MKLSELLIYRKSLQKLGSVEFAEADIMWHYADALDVLQVAFDKYDKMREDYVVRHGTDEGGGKYRIDNMDAYIKRMDELTGIDIDIEFRQVHMNELSMVGLTVDDVRVFRKLGIIKK